MIVAVLGAVLVATIGLAPQLFAVCADEAFARVLGLRVRAYNLLIVVLAAITVTTAMRTVGLLLVGALLVVPVATSQNLFAGFRAGLFGAMGIGVVVSLSGVVGSFYADVPPGALIVVLAIVAFAVSWPISSAAPPPSSAGRGRRGGAGAPRGDGRARPRSRTGLRPPGRRTRRPCGLRS